MISGHFLTSAIPAFLASLVEFVEALTIVLAVGITRGWRDALLGTIAGVILLALLVILFGPALNAFPISILQLVVGVLLLFFGLRWLRKAILRYAGVISMHDEAAIFEKERAALAAGGSPARRGIDWLGATTAFKAVTLEGLEVIFIVIAVGVTANQLVPASIGAAAAGVIVVAAGAALKGPLAAVPENTLKFVVGVLLSTFGTFWAAEGLHFAWPGEDFSLLGIIAAYGIASAIAFYLAKNNRRGLRRAA